MRTKLRIKTTLLFLAFAVALLSGGGTAMAITTDTSGTTSSSPTIQSDKADYAPGELVTLRGSNWQPGESVRIVVDDDGLQEQTWGRDVVVTADEFGNVRDEFTLPSWFVATYQVTATGELSGTATTTFTDNLDATSGGVNGGSSVTIGPGLSETAPAHLTVTQTASSPLRDWRSALVTVTGQGRSWRFCDNTIFHTLAPGGTATEHFTVFAPGLPTPTPAGTYDVVLTAASAKDCEGFTDTVTLTNAITVDPNVIFSDYFSDTASHLTNWTETETVRDTDCRIAGPSSNNFHAELRSNCSITTTINTSGRQNLSLKYLWGKGGQSGQLNVDWRVGTSGSFLPLASHDFNSDGVSGTGVPNSNTVNLPTTANNKSIQLRFTGTGDNEARVDAILVSGTEIPPNTPPTAEANGPYNVNEGGSVTLSSAGSTDPGGSIASYAWDLDNDGAFDDSTDQNPTFSAAGLDGPSSRTVRLQVTDNNGATGTDTATVNVPNVAPSVTAPANQSSDEGFPHAFNLGSFSDAGANDGPWTVDVDWDDGSNDSTSKTSTGSLGTMNHVYTDGPATKTVTVKVTDKDGDFQSKSFTVTVNNVAPSVSNLSGPAQVDEDKNGSETYTFTVTDPGIDTFTVTSGFPDCGTGGSLVGGSLVTTGNGGTFSCRFSDGLATPTVRIQVRDADEPAGSTTADSNVATKDVTVNNVVPNVTGVRDENASEGTANSFDLGSFTDPGDDDPWTATVDWGDGSGSESLGSFNSPSSLGTKSHTYADNGSYTVTVTVSEAGSGAPSGSDTSTATVLNVDPVIGTNPLSLNGATGTACLSGNTVTLNSVSFTDAGTADTHIGTVEWGDASDSSDVQALTITEHTGSGSTNSLQHTYDPGTYTLTVTITDDDSGADSKTASVSKLYNMTGILSPINADGSSIFKYGSTVPVKIQITDCDNKPVSGLAPKVSVSKTSGDPPVTTVNESIISTSAADSGSVLRYSDPQYIFNMNTKSSLCPDSTATYRATVKGTTTSGQVVTNPAEVSQQFALKPK